MPRKRLELAGRRFDKVVVCHRAPKRGRDTMWVCKCDCGKTFVARASNLNRSGTTSCGCKWKRRGSQNKRWTGFGDITGTYWAAVKANAKGHGREFAITIEEAWEKYQLQQGRCALTGWPLSLSQHADEGQTASIDRIDSSKGYVTGNIQWVHKDVNRMKQDYADDYFIRVCLAVATQHATVVTNG